MEYSTWRASPGLAFPPSLTHNLGKLQLRHLAPNITFRFSPLPPTLQYYSLIFLKQIRPNRCLSACTLINENIVRMEIRSQMFNTLFKKSSASLKSSTNPNMTDVQGSFAWGRLKCSLWFALSFGLIKITLQIFLMCWLQNKKGKNKKWPVKASMVTIKANLLLLRLKKQDKRNWGTASPCSG